MAVKKRTGRRVAKKPAAGLHPVFGPVADPGPIAPGSITDLGSWFGGLGGLGGFGPIADAGPVFWQGSIADRVERSALSAEDQRTLAAVRLKRVHAAVEALEAQVAIADEEFAILSRKGKDLVLDKRYIPHVIGPGDPGPEFSPVDLLRYVHEVRVNTLRRTLQFLKESSKALEASTHRT